MRILITNDDGIDSPGLSILRERLGERHELFITAPDRDRSGAAQSISVGAALKATEREQGVWSLSGTPADCVRVGIGALCRGEKPDLVVSGINLGANLGTDILLSGTVGAARHAAMIGIPALAISTVEYREPADLETAARFLAANAERLAEAIPAGKLLNINAPRGEASAVAIARPGRLPYELRFEISDDEEPRTKRIVPRASVAEGELRGDCLAARKGRIVLSAFDLWGPDEELESSLEAILPELALQQFELRP
jgi:5''/3''-nucleotidase SurE